MKKISYFLVAVLTATIVFVGCKKKTDSIPRASEFFLATSVMTTSNKGNIGTALTSIEVDTLTGSAIIRLDVTSSVDLAQIYIMKSVDNGALTEQSIASVTTADGKTFAGGSSSYSLAIPSGTQSFVLDIPVSLRTAGPVTSDLYYIWITSSTGDFLKPTKNTVLGPAVVSFNYTKIPITPFTIGAATLGDQYASQGSLLVTSGQMLALGTADYVDVPSSVDIALGDLNGAATAITTGAGTGNLYLFSPSLRSSLGYTGCTTCGAGGTALAEPTGNLTYIAPYIGYIAFEKITGPSLAALVVGTSTKVAVTVNGVYMFQTSAGKKGLIKVTATTAGIAGIGTADVSVKVLN
jgi:hypothetical protein